jgi:Rps23 Pro-64 3,4-dihydroxylase Tpa1-like proline 4-hydroxylase
MEIKDFIKVYDDTCKVETISSFIKYVNRVSFEDACVIGNPEKNDLNVINKNIRSTQIYNWNKDSNKLTDVHWTYFWKYIFENAVKEYQQLFEHKIPLISLLEISSLKYETGDFYKAHTDHHGNIPRTLSIIYFLNNDYEGGSIFFQNPMTGEDIMEIKPEIGRLLLWPSNFIYPHRVDKVTKGRRHVLVSWWL